VIRIFCKLSVDNDKKLPVQKVTGFTEFNWYPANLVFIRPSAMKAPAFLLKKGGGEFTTAQFKALYWYAGATSCPCCE
jgi:hypothetical protein